MRQERERIAEKAKQFSQTYNSWLCKCGKTTFTRKQEGQAQVCSFCGSKTLKV